MQTGNKKFKQEEGLELSEQQGFFTEKIEIKKANQTHSRSISVHTRTHFNRQPFQAKFLPWSGPMKKEPIQALKDSNSCVSHETGEKAQRRKNRTSPQHPYKLYAINENYELIYNRTNLQPIVNDKYFMSNEIRLQHVGGKNSEGFKKIKDFDMKQISEAKAGSLIFDSKFQCGNLHCVYKNTKYQEYILFMDNDTNSLGYNQWFYFSIRNNQANVDYTFKIVNFKKKHSFFKYGSKPAVFSLTEAKLKGEGWSKKAKNVVYEQSPIYIQQLPETKFYCLSFNLNFDHKDDYIMVAMSLPYSYTKMITFLKQVEILAQSSEEQRDLQFKIKSVCLSVCGNDIPEVTISRKSQEEQKKKMIIIMARQHPGQIWSSYMVEGMIRKLVSKPDENIAWLLDHYIFKIYPMINVDGVIYGNFRCDITGFDMNRRWKDTSKLMHPQIFQIKRKISQYRSECKIECCFDLHGHSKNYNIFCYSCKDNQLSCRILPLIISKVNSDFCFPSCTFGISKYKQTTARAAIYKLIKNENVLTIQSSFYGSKIDGFVKEFGPQDIYMMGSDILTSCKYFLDKKSKMLQIVRKQIQNRINDFLAFDKQHQEDSGSQSDPSGDQIDLQTKIKKIFDKNVITIEQLKGQKTEAKRSPIKIKVQEQNKLQIKGQQYKKRKAELTKSNAMIKQISPTKNQCQTIEQPSLTHSNNGQIQQKKSEKRSKKTISYSQQKNIEKDTDQLKISHPAFRQRKQKFSLHGSQQTKSQRQSKQLGIRFQKKSEEIETKRQPSKFRQSLADEELQRSIQNVKKSDQFIKKFERFIPISVGMKGRANLSMFEQDLYNQDQGNLINLLLENKKKIELQKIKRNVQKSTYIVERQGKVKISNRQQKVVDFKSFKQNEKINQQIRKLVSLRYSVYDQ